MFNTLCPCRRLLLLLQLMLWLQPQTQPPFGQLVNRRSPEGCRKGEADLGSTSFQGSRPAWRVCALKSVRDALLSYQIGLPTKCSWEEFLPGTPV